ncbi:MAG: hypothetical protein ACSHXI_15530 [Hoeflea sp.]|uniref:hypothetical protein n=1 Tax=Hoeflea sp. TaxID=1940281 RepID=UPI003EF20973
MGEKRSKCLSETSVEGASDAASQPVAGCGRDGQTAKYVIARHVKPFRVTRVSRLSFHAGAAKPQHTFAKKAFFSDRKMCCKEVITLFSRLSGAISVHFTNFFLLNRLKNLKPAAHLLFRFSRLKNTL